MAEASSKAGGAPSLNLNTLLALLTLAGSVWFVSQKLTSDRPVMPAGGSRPFVGEQTLEARLWEDPFKSADSQHGKVSITNSFNTLAEQIRERSESQKRVLLLPVMLSGGQYSEDQESRIRSRFAIVSALGVSGYAPEDAEYIGALKIPWPTQHQVDQAKTNTACTNLWVASTPLSCGVNVVEMDVRYEWYRPRTFFPRPNGDGPRTNVLVLWLDDSFFEDEPLLRLPLLLEPLTDTKRLQTTNAPDVALIGPRRSSTLRAMLPGRLADTDPLSGVTNTHLWPLASNILQHIAVYCATPSAMDEVLVETNASIYLNPRADCQQQAMQRVPTKIVSKLCGNGRPACPRSAR